MIEFGGMQDKEKYSDTLPKKYMASGALITNETGEVMILYTTYKDRWEIPGGIVEANESPRDACRREIKEELGLDLEVGRLLCVDYSINVEDVENLQFIFDGGVLSQEQIDQIVLADGEIKSFSFLLDKKEMMQRERLGPRLIKSLEAKEKGTCYYLEKGE